MRSVPVLQLLLIRICAGFHQDGEGTESVSESGKNIGCVRTLDVLSEK